MKLNKILMVLAATAIVGCTSEDLNDFNAKQAPEDSRLIELNSDFALAGVGVESAMTRTHWEQDAVSGALVNKFLPIYKAGATFASTLDKDADVLKQAVGLCWLGNGAVGTDVYTNYEFYHFGWLNKGATNAEFECNVLTNGALYNEITPLAAITNGAGGEADEVLDFAGAIPGKSLAAGVDNLNYNSGIYKTENKAIFGGQYIVYYPYNQDFKNAGTIPAKAETKFAPVSEDYTTAAIGKATFRYSAPVTIEGGSQAADFGLYNLSAIAQLRVAGPTGVEIGKNINQIVLYSPSQKLLKQANLAADKIAAGDKGTALYTSTEGTKTIVANFAADVPVHKTNGTAVGGDKPISAYITVLPTTVDDLVAFVHSIDGKWATVNLGNTVFGAGKAQVVNIPVTADAFKADYIAVDEPTLIAARNEARATATALTPKTITVIGDITLDGTTADAVNTYNFNNGGSDAFITYAGDAIIVPQDITLTSGTNWQSDLRVLGKSCCTGTNGAVLNVAGGTLNNVTMVPTEDKAPTAAKNPTVNYNGNATIAAGKTFDAQAGTIHVNPLAAPAVAVQHKGDINIAEGVTLTIYTDGDLNFMGGSVVNNGTIEVKKGGKFDMTAADGSATATDGQRMTNNGKFIHNVDAGVGTAVQSMAQNGEYRCRVDEQIKLDDALLQWTACSVIEMVNKAVPQDENYNLGTAAAIDPAAYKHNGQYIDYEINTPGQTVTFNNPGATNGDSKVIEVGKLTVVAGGLNVDYVKGTGKRTLTVHGEMVVNAATEFTDSKAIILDKNLTINGAGTTLTFKGAKKNEGGLTVAGDVTVTRGTFDAGNAAADVDALDITCANFYLKSGATAIFGNRTEGDAHNMDVKGIIDNPAGCTFNIKAANQDGNGSVLAWVTCSTLKVGGNWGAARPRVK